MKRAVKSTYINEVKKRISLEMPRVLEEVSVYESKLSKGQLTINPKTAPQFNG